MRFVSSRERTASTSSTWSSTGHTSRAVRSRCVWENRDRAGMRDSSRLTAPVWNEEAQVTHITRWHRAKNYSERFSCTPSVRVFHTEYWLLHVSFDLACGEEVRSLHPHSRWTHLLSQQNDLNRRILDYLRYFSWITSRTNRCLHCNSSRGRESVKLTETFNPAQKDVVPRHLFQLHKTKEKPQG